jgi:hypothetical protein
MVFSKRLSYEDSIMLILSDRIGSCGLECAAND